MKINNAIFFFVKEVLPPLMVGTLILFLIFKVVGCVNNDIKAVQLHEKEMAAQAKNRNAQLEHKKNTYQFKSYTFPTMIGSPEDSFKYDVIKIDGVEYISRIKNDGNDFMTLKGDTVNTMFLRKIIVQNAMIIDQNNKLSNKIDELIKLQNESVRSR